MNPSPLNADKIVVLTFDDLWKSQVGFCFPVLRDHGYRATFFVPNEAFGDEMWDGRLADPQLAVSMLWDAGMDIGAHSYHGTAPASSLQETDDKIISCGVPKPVSYGYPGFLPRRRVRVEVPDRYLISRLGVRDEFGGRAKSLDGATGSTYTLGSDLHPVFCTGVFGLNYGVKDFKKDLDQKVGGSEVGIFCFHAVGENRAKGSTLEISEGGFLEVIQMLEDSGTAVISLRELIALKEHPILRSPFRSPRAVAKRIRPWIEGKHVRDLGSAMGDSMLDFLWDGGARRVSGIERKEPSYLRSLSRGLDVTLGNYFSDQVKADVYYFWVNEVENLRLAEFLSSVDGDFTYIMCSGTKHEMKSARKVYSRFDGELINVDFDEGSRVRQAGSIGINVVRSFAKNKN